MRRFNVLVLTAFALLFGAAWLTPAAPTDSTRIESIGDLLLPVQPIAVTMPTQWCAPDAWESPQLAHTDGTLTAVVSLTLGTPVTDLGGSIDSPVDRDDMAHLLQHDTYAYYTANAHAADYRGLFGESAKEHNILGSFAQSDSCTFNPSVTDLVYC